MHPVKKHEIMAMPIKYAPVLRDNDSKRFNENLKNSSSNKIDPSERERVRKLVKQVDSGGAK